MSIQYFQIGIEYWYFQYFCDFPSNWSIGIEYFYFPSFNTQYFCISKDLNFWFKFGNIRSLLNTDSNFGKLFFVLVLDLHSAAKRHCMVIKDM